MLTQSFYKCPAEITLTSAVSKAHYFSPLGVMIAARRPPRCFTFDPRANPSLESELL